MSACSIGAFDRMAALATAESFGENVAMRSALRPGTYTVVFTDLRGSTALRVNLGDQRFDEIVARHDEALTATVEDAGGTLVKSLGDGVIAVFEGAVGALTAATAMQQRIDLLGRDLSMVLDLAIGMSAGDVGATDDDVHGTPVVEAARLCAVARGGQILAADVVRVLAGSRGAFSFDAVGELSLKGLPDPVRTFDVAWTRVTAENRTHFVAPEIAALARGGFVGRVVEHDRLQRLWKLAASGATACGLVSGDPGIGKTRLAAQIATMAHAEGAVVLFGGCDDGAGVAFQPWARALGAYCMASDADALAEQIGSLGNELARIVPALGAKLPALAPPLSVDPESDRLRLFESVAELLASIGRAHPVLLVLDDVHWADAPSLVLLRHVLQSAAISSLLVIATYRDSELDRTHPLSSVLADLRRSPRATIERISLLGLSAADVAQFVELAAAHELDAAGKRLAQAVHRETEGNPFFVGELIRHLAASGALTHDGDRWVVTDDLATAGLPEGIREVVGRRLSRLSPQSNEVLSIASVCGPRFDAAVIAAAMKTDADRVLDACEEALQARLVVEDLERPARYAFAHALVRQTLEAEQSLARRTRSHRSIAIALEAAGADVAELARHFAACAPLGESERALRYTRTAAQRAIDELAFEEAAALYARAIDVTDLDGDPATRCDLLTARGDALRRAGDPAHRHVLLEAVGLAAGDGPRLAAIAFALNTGETMSTFSGIDEEVVAICEQALVSLDPSGSAERARLLALLAVELSLAPDHTRGQRGRLLYAEALAIARRLDDQRCLGDVLVMFGAGYHNPDTFDELPIIGRELDELADQLGDQRLRLAGNLVMICAAAERGDCDAATALNEQRHQLGLRVRDALAQWGASAMDVSLRFDRLDLAGTADLVEMAAASGRTLGVPPSIVEAVRLAQEGMLLLLSDPACAAARLPIAEFAAEAFPSVRVFSSIASLFATETGDFDRARVHLSRVVGDDFTDLQRNFTWASIVATTALVAAELDATDACRGARRVLLPLTGRFAWTGVSVSGVIDLSLGALSAALGDHAAAAGYFDRAIAQCARPGLERWLVETQTEYAKALLRIPDGDHEKARSLATAAFHRAHAAGAFRLADRAQRVLDRLGDGSPRTSPLGDDV